MRSQTLLRVGPPVGQDGADSSYVRYLGLACIAAALLTALWLLLELT